MVNPEEQIYANAFNLIPQLGAVRIGRILGHFKTFRKAWEANRSDYVSAGFNPKLVEQIVSKKLEIDPSIEFAKLAKYGIETVLINSAEYPTILKEISAPPPILYVRGNVKALRATSVAVVGTRKMTSYGKAAAQEITEGLVSAGLAVVSGLAFGIDAAALETATRLGGLSVGVLASPIDDDSISPRANFLLGQKIMEKGCIISEYGLGVQVQKQNFPIRNRIISGLSLGTLVVEADSDSGALITANYALEQNREVFAVPGPIYSEVSRGTNSLIKRGAKLVTSAFDILEELHMGPETAPVLESSDEITPQEEELLSTLSREPTHIDDITRKLNWPASTINYTLVMLEMKGRIRNLGGAKFARIR